MTTETQTVAQVMLRFLGLEGVTHIFGIPGGGIANFITELKDQRESFEFVICRHETGAAYMADGYYRATGKLGVVLVTTGPGATNALTGTLNAQNGCTALLTLTGEINEQFYGKGYLQEGTDTGLDVNAMYAAATRYSSVIVDQSDVEALLRQALRDALSRPRRAVHLSIPNNVAAEPVASITVPATPSAYRALPQGAPGEQVAEALKLLLACKRPLIFLGNGCREAMREPATRRRFEEFVTKHAIPVMTSADGKGVFSESHEMSLRVYGCANCMWPYYWMRPQDPGAPPYDGLLVVGSSLGDLSTNAWNPLLVPDGPLMQVDMDQAIIARAFDVTLGIVAEAGAFLKGLAEHPASGSPDSESVDARRRLVAEIKSSISPFSSPDDYASVATPIHPAAMMRVLQETLPQDSMIFLDAGNCVGWGLHYLAVDWPQEIHSALSMGPMGFAAGAVVGAKFGRPQSTCVALLGDGAFMMHGAEVSTAKRHGVGAIWIVLYDDDLNMVVQGQEHYFPDPNNPEVWQELYDLGTPDLAQVARGFGADGYDVHDPAGLAELMPNVVRLAGEGRPQVVVVHIDRCVVPPYYNPLYAPASK